MLLDKSNPYLLRQIRKAKKTCSLKEKKSLQRVELGHIRTGNFIPGLSPKALKHLV